jgi:hypothetical protein
MPVRNLPGGSDDDPHRQRRSGPRSGLRAASVSAPELDCGAEGPGERRAALVGGHEPPRAGGVGGCTRPNMTACSCGIPRGTRIQYLPPGLRCGRDVVARPAYLRERSVETDKSGVPVAWGRAGIVVARRRRPWSSALQESGLARVAR